MPTTPEYRRAPYISSMSHNSGGVTNLWKKYVSKFEESPPDDDGGGVGCLNCTPRLVKPLITVTLSFESYVTYMMNPNLGNPPKIQSQKDDTLVMAQTKSTRMLNMLQLN